MKELDDVPVKIDLNDVSEEQLLKELDSESNADLHNTMKISENIEGHGVLRGSGSETTLDEKGVDDASLGSKCGLTHLYDAPWSSLSSYNYIIEYRTYIFNTKIFMLIFFLLGGTMFSFSSLFFHPVVFSFFSGCTYN